jgi:AcrR family transcriptional regulator
MLIWVSHSIAKGASAMPTSLANSYDDYEDDETSDGRRLRAARNREAVVSATLEIIREQQGGPVPGAGEIAERAGVSERTVFRHFADLDSLFMAASNLQRPILLQFLGPRPDMAELDKRIAAVTRLRSRLYEQIGPVRRVASRIVTENAVLTQAMEEANRTARAQLADVFAPELQRAGRTKNQLLDQLDLVTSWPSWEYLRAEQHVGPDKARRVISDLMTGILSPYAARKRR